MEFLLAGFRGTSFPLCERALDVAPQQDRGIVARSCISETRPSNRVGMLVDAAARSKGCTEELTHFERQTCKGLTTDCPRHAPATVPARKLEGGSRLAGPAGRGRALPGSPVVGGIIRVAAGLTLRA